MFVTEITTRLRGTNAEYHILKESSANGWVGRVHTSKNRKYLENLLNSWKQFS
jgi:hypothetical protein